MKAESTIKKRLSLIKRRIDSIDRFLECVKHKPETKAIKAYKNERVNLEGHFDALRWVLNQ